MKLVIEFFNKSKQINELKQQLEYEKNLRKKYEEAYFNTDKMVDLNYNLYRNCLKRLQDIETIINSQDNYSTISDLKKIINEYLQETPDTDQSNEGKKLISSEPINTANL